VPEWRRRKGRHSLASLVKQRVFQIACGYEDQNDSDALREDPLLKMVCGSQPESGEDLASQPTICRMENASTRNSCHRIAEVLFELYLTQREKDGAPERVLLDFDSTDDPTHGEQEGSYYHGYYRQHMYHPLLVFDGHSGHLITALLRAGNTHASNSSVALLKRIVSRLRERWPEVEIELRADAGFAVPALHDYCEREGITYTIALITNPRLEEIAEGLLKEASEEHERTARKAGSSARIPTRRQAGSRSAGSSTRPKSWSEGPTGASSLARGTTNRRPSTNFTQGAEKGRTG
jgi:hypothetical protein